MDALMQIGPGTKPGSEILSRGFRAPEPSGTGGFAAVLEQRRFEMESPPARQADNPSRTDPCHRDAYDKESPVPDSQTQKSQAPEESSPVSPGQAADEQNAAGTREKAAPSEKPQGEDTEKGEAEGKLDEADSQVREGAEKQGEREKGKLTPLEEGGAGKESLAASGLESGLKGKKSSDKPKEGLVETRRSRGEGAVKESGKGAPLDKPQQSGEEAAPGKEELSLKDKDPAVRHGAMTGKESGNQTLSEKGSLVNAPAGEEGEGKLPGRGRAGLAEAKNSPSVEVSDLRSGKGTRGEGGWSDQGSQDGHPGQGRGQNSSAQSRSGHTSWAQSGASVLKEAGSSTENASSDGLFKMNGQDSMGLEGMKNSATQEVSFKSSAGETPSGAFARHLRESLNSDIVKQAKFVLKDQGAGEIKLILKPESLGRVKIQLNLQENNIAGRIIVENSSVREAFEKNMASLQKALRESGYETEGLEVTVDQGQTSREGFGHEQGNRDGARRLVRLGRAAAALNQSVPTLREGEIAPGVSSADGRINLVI